MVFRIVNFSKEHDIYTVISNTGEKMNVKSAQIINVMLQGYQFDNAYLTQKGFAVQTNTGTRYFQVRMDKNTQALVTKFLTAKKLHEQQLAEQQRLAQLKQQQEADIARQAQEAEKLRQKQEEQKRQHEQKRQPQVQNLKVIYDVSGSTASGTNRATKIQGNAGRPQKIMYRGDLYLSDIQLCKKFKADVEKFKELRNKGYSIDEALGLKPLRPESELVSMKQLNKVLDYMASQRGEY